MKRSLLAVLAAGATLVASAATPAFAEVSQTDLAKAGHKLAQCLYSKRRADVVASLATDSAAEFDRYYRLFSRSQQCGDVGISNADVEGMSFTVPADVLRGMLAEVALGDQKKLYTLQPVQGASYQRGWFAATGRNAAVDEMAVCTADQNPDGVRSLIATAPQSDDEKGAVQSLSPTLGSCLPQGATLNANRQALRAALADALYQRATAPALASK
jgi:hypothetical protein